MKELQIIQETTPKGKGMTGNHSLALKQLWVNETKLVPIVQIQIANDGIPTIPLQNLDLHYLSTLFVHGH